MRLMPVTNYDGLKMYINPNKIHFLQPHDDMTIIHFGEFPEAYIEVRESLDVIANMIEGLTEGERE